MEQGFCFCVSWVAGFVAEVDVVSASERVLSCSQRLHSGFRVDDLFWGR